VSDLPNDLRFTPVIGKQPCGKEWQDNPLTKEQVISCIEQDSSITGVGVLCGVPSSGYLFLDHDGASCDELIERLTGLSLEDALPTTVSFTSGKEGRRQEIYKVPEVFWDGIRTRKLKTGQFGIDKKAEQLEFRWTGCQSVIHGIHPDTKNPYFFINPFSYTAIADAPQWMLDQMLKPLELPKVDYKAKGREPLLSDILEALGFVEADDYDDWINIGMALHSQSIDLLGVWDSWSEASEKYTEGDCAAKWDGFSADGSITIWKLFQIANANGYVWTDALQARMDAHLKEIAGKARSYTSKPSEFALELEDLDTAENLEGVEKLKKAISNAWNKVAPSVPSDLRSTCEALAATGGIPEMNHLLTVLGVASAAVSATHTVDIPRNDKPWIECLNTFTALIAPAGCGKSECFASAIKPFHDAQEVLTRQWKEATDRFEPMTADEVKAAKEEGNYKKPKPPELHVISFNGGTLEALIKSMAHGYTMRTSMLWQSDEISKIFDSLNKHNKGSDDLKTMLEMFNGGHMSKQTLGGGMVSTPKSPISVIGGIQESEWLYYCKKLSNSKSGSGNGFSGRWINSYTPKDVVRKLSFGGERRVTTDPITEFVARFRACFDGHNYDVPMQIERDAVGFCHDIEQWKERGSNETGLNNHYSKGVSYIYRLAALLALINDPHTGSISRTNLEAAMAIMDYSIAVSRLIEDTGDTTTAQGAIAEAHALGLRKGKLDAHLLGKGRIGAAGSDRQSIIQKVAEAHGGNLSKNRCNKFVWTP